EALMPELRKHFPAAFLGRVTVIPYLPLDETSRGVIARLHLDRMAVKGLQYQAMMTSLNGVHFGFQCSMRRAWWYMFALPVLLMV
ncbi:hypothetical protein MJM95_29235, partial [Salmonella enterica subsp. enterica serovar Anatum]|nr:hypothetical protein [Salmonella enterica subsp. enterica serovar Anatum]